MGCGASAITPGDYTDPSNWFVRDVDGTKKVDCFYVHPTTELGVMSTSINRQSYSKGTPARIKDNTSGDPDLLENQAGCFTDTCNLWAPRYSQAGMMTILGDQDKPAAISGLGLAFKDVCDALNTFLNDRTDKERPFIIAAHSQGSMAAMKAIKTCIDGTAHEKKFIAAYLAGGYVPKDVFGTVFKGNLHECTGPTDTNCIISWDTRINGLWKDDAMSTHQAYYHSFGQYCDHPGKTQSVNLKPRVQISPVTWTSAITEGTKLEYLGAKQAGSKDPVMPPSGYSDTFKVTEQAVLVDDPRSWLKNCGPSGASKAGNLHPIDFHFWYFNIKQNVEQRVAAFSSQK